MTEIFAQFVAEVRPNLIDEIEAAYGRAFAELAMSALPPTAAQKRTSLEVRFVPIGDIPAVFGKL